MPAIIKRLHWLLPIIALGALVLIGLAPVQGNATNWKGSGEVFPENYSWFFPDNWDNGVPNSSTDAYIELPWSVINIGQHAYARNLVCGNFVHHGVGGVYMAGGSLNTENTVVGNYGNGTFSQYEGTTHTVSGILSLGAQEGSNGSYSLFLGTLTADREVIGDNGYGQYCSLNYLYN